MISHDRSFLKNVTNRLLLIENQQLEVFEGGYEQAEEYLEVKALEDQILKEQADETKEDNKDNTSIPDSSTQETMK